MPQEKIVIDINGLEFEINKKTFEDFRDFVSFKYGKLNDDLLAKEMLEAMRAHMEFKKTESSE
ncbi:hypothetical protein [Methanobacterium ferruginis]|uniref:hypothetical protein n=1 Tax=Methanobacterium ferruginis TaxID=710191 RepID=UPI0025729630|nr:hypothetical protein [Methanobacterium ferruginis]BDZ68559.1 hypothetical protein GCM10025860_20070 [Methanobacterium ferruginis]